MNDRKDMSPQELRQIKSTAKIMAKQWVFNNADYLPNILKSTNNKAYNDNCVIELKSFYTNFVLNMPHDNIEQLYMFKYVTKMMIDIIETNSEKQSYCSYSDKPKSRGI